MIKKTELYIENKQIDLFGDEAFLLNFNVADISDISAKAASYSKEVDIPATKENNITFSHLFNVSSEGHFNPISKKTSQVYVDGVCVMQGYFKLNNITIIDNEYVTYHGVIYEDSVNFVQTLGDLELSNLVLPLTGTTQTPTGSTGTITINQLTGIDYRFKPPQPAQTSTVPAGRWYNVNYNNVITTGGIFGSLQPVDKNIPNSPWLGVASQNSPTTINAFVALQPIIVNLTPAITISPSRTVTWQWYKVTPSGSTYLHTPIGGSYGGNFLTSSITTPSGNVQLSTGQGIYLLIRDTNAVLYTGTTPPLPIGIGSTSQITGTIQATNPTVVNNLLINESFILNNINATTNSDTSSICFPLVDYNQTYPYSATNKKNSQLTEAERPAVRVSFEDLRPGVFVKPVWDAIFKQSGFKYKSKFLDTNADLFKKLIVIGGMDDDEVQALQYDSVLTGTTPYVLTEPLQDLEINASGSIGYGYLYRAYMLGGKVPNASPTNYWNKKFIRPTYTENLLVQYTDIDRNNAAHGFSGVEYGDVLKAFVSGKYKIQAQIDATSQAVRYGTGTAPLNKQGLVYRLKIETLKGGSFNNDPVLFTAPAKSKWKEVKVVTFKRDLTLGDQDFKLSIDETIELEQGDTARVVLYASAEAQFDPSNTDATAYQSKTILKQTGGCYVKYFRLGSWLGYEATSLTNMLPRSMKQSEFIIGIAKMFNLYFEPDKQDPRTIYIEPRDTYYEDGRVLNWEKKLDYSKPIDINILPHDQAKAFVFKYTDDSSDYYTEQFKKFTPNALTFGSYEFVSDDEYVTETTDLETIFSASYLQKISGTDPLNGYTGPDANPMVITKIIDPDSQKPGYEGTPSSWKKEPRILVYGGKIQLPPYESRNYQFFLTSNEPDGDVYEIDLAYYPYAGHFDKPVEPTVDINFYTDTAYLPTTYWKNNFGNAYPTTPTTSSTSLNLSTLTVGQNVVLNYTGVNYFNVNPNVDKYVRVTSGLNSAFYFTGLIVSSTSGTITLKITSIYGTGTWNAWRLQLVDVQMKYNLFNVFYKQQMIELTDQSARLMTCNIYLTPVDIANFRFNDVVYAHGEYWRVNKIVDYDTSSDVTQTTQVELIKIVRAQTNKLIDYIQGGYLGIQGGTGGGTTTTGTGTLQGTTPSVVQLGPIGTPGIYTNDTASQLNVLRNSIIRDGEGLAPTFFEKEVTVYTGTQDLQDTVIKINNDLNLVRETADSKPIGEGLILTEADAENLTTIPEGVSQVYFENTNRRILFNIVLQDVAPDGYVVNFNPLNDSYVAVMRIDNGNATSNAIFPITLDYGLSCKFDATRRVWNIQPV